MKNISEIDKNFKIETKLNLPDVKFYDVKNEPFSIHGVYFEDGKFRRLPESVAKTVNEGVLGLHANTAGGRVRFMTDSSYVAINVKMPIFARMPHFALTGSSGFDLYVKKDGVQHYAGTFTPPYNTDDMYESVINLGGKELREITINMPTYSDVSELYIGIEKSAKLEKAPDYKHTKPIVYYGSSITQGGCVSRPGNTYQGIIERRFDTDYINLGFSGSARGEDTIADYIKNLSMSVFVYDYDYNAPTVEHLRATHERMFLRIREQNPDLPIVMMSRPNYFLDTEAKQRFDIVKATYDNAVSRGDKNVYLIGGPTLMAKAEYEGTVDGCHPNDLGFYSMAAALGDILEIILKRKCNNGGTT